jgi:hypothetical protein
VDLLLERGANINASHKSNQKTCLHVACCSRTLEPGLVDFLLAKGADVKAMVWCCVCRVVSCVALVLRYRDGWGCAGPRLGRAEVSASSFAAVAQLCQESAACRAYNEERLHVAELLLERGAPGTGPLSSLVLQWSVAYQEDAIIAMLDTLRVQGRTIRVRTYTIIPCHSTQCL